MLLGFSAGRSLTHSRYGDSISANLNTLAMLKFHQPLLQNVLIQSAQLTGDKGQILPGALEGMLARRHLGFEFSGFLCCSATKSPPTLCDPVDCGAPGFPVLHHCWSPTSKICSGDSMIPFQKFAIFA